MSKQITAQQIKATREKYGLSQRAFAALLGIGEATIVRYEQGATPTRANANLILAADDPHFMAGCLARAGESLTARQRERAQRYIYAFVELPPAEEEDPAMKMNEIYDFTLRQEVLNERCANLIADIIRIQAKDQIEGGDGSQFSGLLMSLSRLKPTIATRESRDWDKLNQISGYLDCAQEMLLPITRKEAS